MTDDQQWQAPDAAAHPPGTPAVPPLTAPPRTGPPGGAPGWTPPPRPGLIPLRPMTLGTILAAAFQTLRRNPGATLAPALILSVLVAVIQALGSAGFLTQYLAAVSDFSGGQGALGSSTPSVPSGLISGLVGILATSLVSGVFALIASAIIDGIVTLQVASSTLGSRLRLSALWGRLGGRRGALIGWAFLTGAVALLVVAVAVGLLLLLASTGTAGIVAAVVLGLFLGLGLAVAFAWLWVKLGFVPGAIVLERAGIRTAMVRSWVLTRRAFWRTFGIRLLVVAMISVATQIIATPISLILSIGGTILSPNGTTSGAASNAVILSLVATQAVTAVISAVGLVVSSATVSLLYLDRRMRVEGLDLDLAAYVERRGAGAQGLPDPYLAPERAGSA